MVKFFADTMNKKNFIKYAKTTRDEHACRVCVLRHLIDLNSSAARGTPFSLAARGHGNLLIP